MEIESSTNIRAYDVSSPAIFVIDFFWKSDLLERNLQEQKKRSKILSEG
jgi:hypothetical protein